LWTTSSWQRRTRASFDAPFEPIAFRSAPEPARARINRWVEDQPSAGSGADDRRTGCCRRARPRPATLGTAWHTVDRGPTEGYCSILYYLVRPRARQLRTDLDGSPCRTAGRGEPP